MRLLIYGNYPPPYGGVPRVIEDLARYLGKRGGQACVISGGPRERRGIDGGNLWRPERLHRIAGLVRYWRSLRRAGSGWLANVIARNPRMALWYLSYAAIGCAIIERERAQAILAFNAFSFGPIGLLTSRVTGVPLVLYSLGELFPSSHCYQALRQFRGLLPTLVSDSSLIISPTRHCASGFARFGLGCPATVIHTGVDTTRFRPGLNVDSLKNDLDLPGQIILYFGRFDKEMGVGVFLEAAKKWIKRPRTSLVLAGQGGDMLEEAYRFSQAFPHRVRVLEAVSNEIVPQLFTLANIVVVPTMTDRACGALAAAEAMAVGSPVVASSIGGVPEVFPEENAALLVPPGDPDALTQVVTGLLNDIQTARQYAIWGQEFVLEHWNGARTNAHLLDAIELAIGGQC